MFLSSHLRGSVSRLVVSRCSNFGAATCSAQIQSRRNFASLTSLIKELRTQTGAPMVECKKALSDPEVDGDLIKAVEWLRKNGSAKAASKLAGREASEGLVGVLTSADGQSASIVRVASETDFSARSESFGKLVEEVASAALALNGAQGSIDVDGDLLPASTANGTVKAALDEAILAIRENLQISEADRMKTSGGSESFLTGYVHGRIPGSDCAGTSAAIVEVAKIDDSSKATKEEIVDAGKKLAMHVVAAKPAYLNPNAIPADILEKEKAILMEQMADSGKPADILEKIVSGRMRKFYEGVCLTDQAHMVEEGNPTVAKALGDKGLEVKNFQYKSIG